ncbi:aspartyl-tRNA synthetase [Hamiltosporidium magnivora]|uniref:Probable aspartate--tRNA ligase, cytoplasmic n=1 Tax=Hamiltosporidium magnivora TaxID=148818 RepID=A0A4Q9LCG5_9MICR|nr:aspartyl-tRNA synthetase [Hamiltosporidium magnivora]
MEQKMDALSIRPCQNINQLFFDIKNPIVRLRGFVYNIRVRGKRSFLVLRQGIETVQCIYSKGDGCDDTLDSDSYKNINQTPLESFVEIFGKVQITEIKIESCSTKNMEILLLGFKIISKCDTALPFTVKDASQPISGKGYDPSTPKVMYKKCLDSRCLDLRTLHSQSIFRVIDSVMFYFRSFLRKKEFLEIKTSKLIESASEGGANLFEVNFFKKKAFLAQSPQLYKQMAIIGGMKRVYEIGHVYRAEESNINRYLSEFIGMDIEMEINNTYMEIVELIYEMFIFIFDEINKECSAEIENIRKYYHFENLRYKKQPLIFSFKECVAMLREENVQIQDLEDFSRENEKKLGNIIAEKYNVDFFVVKEYPYCARPFYTHQSSEDPLYSKSYDFIMRGEEILSGAQRISDYTQLKENAERCKVDISTISGYLDSFRFGAPMHGGCGIGMERVLKSFFNFNDIRYFNMFPRDPGRLNP